MRINLFFILCLVFFISCGTTLSQETITGNTVANTQVADQASTDCHVVIQTLAAEIQTLEQEKKIKETELGKKLREARASKDEVRLTTLNKEIDTLSQRVKELRKGLLPTLQTQLELKQKNCA